jgi:hypothetical protein
MFTTIQDRNRIANAQATFEERIRQTASRSGQITLGYQGGGSEAMVHAIGPLNFWIAFDDADTRYWNAMGIGNPFKDGSTIIVEINPPKDGINLQVSGAFVEDSAGIDVPNYPLATRGSPTDTDDQRIYVSGAFNFTIRNLKFAC